AGLKPVVDGLMDRPALAIPAGEQFPAAEELEVGLAVNHLDHWRGVLPAHAQDPGEVGPHLEVVLEEQADAVRAAPPHPLVGAGRAAERLALQLVEQEVAELDPGVSGAVFEGPEDAVVAGVEAVLLIALPLAAQLERVASAQEGQVVSVMERVGIVVLVRSGAADVGETASGVEEREPAVGLPAGDAEPGVEIA